MTAPTAAISAPKIMIKMPIRELRIVSASKNVWSTNGLATQRRGPRREMLTHLGRGNVAGHRPPQWLVRRRVRIVEVMERSVASHACNERIRGGVTTSRAGHARC
jgi:hypothetical protein